MRLTIFNKPNLKMRTWSRLGFIALLFFLTAAGCTKSKQDDPTAERPGGSSVSPKKSSVVSNKTPSGSMVVPADLQKELAFLGSDLFSPYAWHLVNLGQSIDQEPDGKSPYVFSDAMAPGNDIHFSRAVQEGYTGRDVSVLISSDGMESSHEDLAANFWADHSRDFKRGSSSTSEDKSAEPTAKSDNEGTALAGLIGATANNSIGVRGVAPGVKMASVNFNSSAPEVSAEKSKNFGGAKAKQASGAFDIFLQGWNDARSRTAYVSASEEYLKQLRQGVTKGRGGKGSVFVKGSGDYYLVNDSSDSSRLYVSNSNFEGDQSSPYLITVASVDARGMHVQDSALGSNLWISAPGGEDGIAGPGLLTTDRSGCDVGLATTEIRWNAKAFDLGERGNKNCNYTRAVHGTRPAAAVLSGSIALILEAARGVNNVLSWRDVKHILASTATKVNSTVKVVEIKHPSIESPSGYVWEQGWVKNKSSEEYSFHNEYGFGRINVDAAICMATHYNGSLGDQLDTVERSSGQPEKEDWKYFSKTDLNLLIPDYNKDGATNTIEVSEDYKIEAIQVRAKVSHAQVGQLALELESPAGTKSIIINANNSLMLGNVANFSGDEVFLTNAFYGEPSKGKWTFRVVDAQAGIEGKLDRWGINIIGRDPSGTTPLPCTKDELSKMGITPDSDSNKEDGGSSSGSIFSSITSFFSGTSSGTSDSSGGSSSGSTGASGSLNTVVKLPIGVSTEEEGAVFYSQRTDPNFESLKKDLSGYILKATSECKDFRIQGAEVIPGLGVSKVKRICQNAQKYTPVENSEEYVWLKEDGSFISYMPGCIDKERKQNRKADILGSGKWSIEKIKTEDRNLLKFWGTYKEDDSNFYSNNYTAKLVLRDNSGKPIGWKSSLVGIDSPFEHSQSGADGSSVISYGGIYLLDWISNGEGGPHIRWSKFSLLDKASSEEEATNACWFSENGSSKSYSVLYSTRDLIWPLQSAVLMPAAECRDYRVMGKESGGLGQSDKPGFCEEDANYKEIETSGEYLWLQGEDFLSYRPGCKHSLMVDKSKQTSYFKLGSGKWAVEEFDANVPGDAALYNMLGIKKKNQFRQKITFKASDGSKKVGWKDHLAAFSGPLRSKRTYSDEPDDYLKIVEWIYQETGKPYFRWIKWKKLGTTWEDDKATSSCAPGTLIPKRELATPSIKEFYPTVALAGNTVTLEGAGFGGDETPLEITVGGVPVVELKEHVDTSIQLVVPDSAVTGIIQLKIGDKVTTSTSILWVPKTFKVLAKPSQDHLRYGLKESDSQYVLYPGDELEFDTVLEWALPAGVAVSSFGQPPVPKLWSNGVAGSFLFSTSRVFKTNHVSLWQEDGEDMGANMAKIRAYLSVPGPTIGWSFLESQNAIDVHVMSHDCPPNYIPLSVRAGPGEQKNTFIQEAKNILGDDANFFIANGQDIEAQAKNANGYYVKVSRIGSLEESYKALRNGSRCATLQPTYEFQLIPFADVAAQNKSDFSIKTQFDYFDGSSIKTRIVAPAKFETKTKTSNTTSKTIVWNERGNVYAINLTSLNNFSCTELEMNQFKKASVYSNLKACQNISDAVIAKKPLEVKSQAPISKPGYISNLAIQAGKEEAFPPPRSIKNPPDSISIFPSAGRVGDIIEIQSKTEGVGFEFDPALTLGVTLGEVPVEIVGRDESVLNIRIPDPAVSGKLKVTIGAKTIESPSVLWVLEDFTIAAKYQNPWEDRGFTWDYFEADGTPTFGFYDSVTAPELWLVCNRSPCNKKHYLWRFRYRQAWLYEEDSLEFKASVKWKLPKNEQVPLGNPPEVKFVSSDSDVGDFGKDNESGIFRAKTKQPDREESDNYTFIYASVGGGVVSNNAVVIDVFEDDCKGASAAIDVRYYPSDLEDDMTWKSAKYAKEVNKNDLHMYGNLFPILGQTKLIWKNESGQTFEKTDDEFLKTASSSDIFNVKLNSSATMGQVSANAKDKKGYSLFVERKNSGAPLRLGSRCVQTSGILYDVKLEDFTGQSIDTSYSDLPMIFEESVGDVWRINQIQTRYSDWGPDANSVFKCLGVGFTYVDDDNNQIDYKVAKVFSNLRGCEEIDPMKSEIVQHLAFGGKIAVKLNESSEAISDQYAPIEAGKIYTVYYQNGKFATQTPAPENKDYIEGNASVHLFSHEISILGHIGLLGEDWRDGKIYSYHNKKVVGTYSLPAGETLRTLAAKNYAPTIERFYREWGTEASSIGIFSATIKIYGNNFDPPGISGGDFKVLFGGDVPAQHIRHRTNYELEVVVPTGAMTGPIKIASNGLTGTSAIPFWVMDWSEFRVVKKDATRDSPPPPPISLKETIKVQASPWKLSATGANPSWKSPVVTYEVQNPDTGSLKGDEFVPRKAGTAWVRATLDKFYTSWMPIEVTCNGASRESISQGEAPVIESLEVQSGVDLDGHVLVPDDGDSYYLTIHGKNLDDASCLTGEKKPFDIKIGGVSVIKSNNVTERKSNLIRLWIDKKDIPSGFVQLSVNGVTVQSDAVLWMRKDMKILFSYQWEKEPQWRGWSGYDGRNVSVGAQLTFKGPEWVMPAAPDSPGAPPEVSFVSSDPEVGNFTGNVFTAKKKGETNIQVRIRNVTIPDTVQVLGIGVQ